MPTLNDVISVDISVQSAGLQKADFAMPLIVGYSPWTGNAAQGAGQNLGTADIVRTYSGGSNALLLAALLNDMGASSPEYLAASALLAQTPSVPAFKVARRKTSAPQSQYTITPTYQNGATYSLSLFDSSRPAAGSTYSYAAASTDTASRIAAQLMAPLWTKSTATSVGQLVNDGLGNLYVCTASSSGSTGSGANPFSAGPAAANGSTPGATVTDGTITWVCCYAVGHASTVPSPITQWQASHAYAIGQIINTNLGKSPGNANATGALWVVTAQASSSDDKSNAAEPTWTASSSPITDNHITWTVCAPTVGAVCDCNLAVTTTTPQSGPTISAGGVLTFQAWAPGIYASIATNDPALLSVYCDNAVPVDGSPSPIAADLAQIMTADSGWWGMLSVSRTESDIADIASWMESNGQGRLFLACSNDSGCVTATYSSSANGTGGAGTDIASFLFNLKYNSTALLYHHNPAQFPDAAWFGAVLPITAGAENWMFRTLSKVDATPLTESQYQTATAAIGSGNIGKCNVYVTFAPPTGMTAKGTVSGGAYQYIDITHGLAALSNAIQTDAFNVLSTAPTKVPFTDAGIAQVVNVVAADLKAYATPSLPFLQSSPPPWAYAAPAAQQNRTSRQVVITIGGTFAGAIDGVSLSGTLTF